MRLWNLRSRHLAHEDWPVRCWSDGGPDTVDNAFSLRSLTRVLIDKGALGASSDYEVKVSRRFTGRITSAKAPVLAQFPIYPAADPDEPADPEESGDGESEDDAPAAGRVIPMR